MHPLFHRMPPSLSAALGLLLAALPSNAQPAPDDSNLLRNIDSIRTTPAKRANQAPVEKLRAELGTLWEHGSDARQPLGVEVVYTDVKNGCKVEGIYINGYKSAAGQDRIFFYYARPEKAGDKIPAYIDLTGGSGPERSLWMAGAYQCAVVDIEWRGPQNRFRSQWTGINFNSMKSLAGSLKDNPAYRLVTGTRRAIDFLEQQPGIDTDRIGCGGGSMGGYYTLLTAGVDDRIKFGVDELGAGHLADTNSQLGQFNLDPEHKAIWIAAFDPFSYVKHSKAKMFMNLSADDYFFWLGDGAAHYQAYPGPKRLCITPNFDHNEGAFGKKKYHALSWLDYIFGRETSFPEITEVRNNGNVYTATTTPGITRATLCWSPGKKVQWPSRYWLEIPAKQTAEGWKAEIPTTYTGLARYSFMTVADAKGRMVSSLPVFTPGIDPMTETGPLWADQKLWDNATGISAWRQIGPNNRHGAPAKLEWVKDRHTLCVSPKQKDNTDFSIVTDSVILASGHAANHAGLVLNLDGGESAGKLKLILVRNFGAAKGQQEYTASFHYNAGQSTVELPWNRFTGSGSPIPFDSLRLDGETVDGKTLEIRSISFLNVATTNKTSLR